MKKGRRKKTNRSERRSERDTMRPEYDFSKGERGKFFRPGAELNVPIYLDPQVAKVVQAQARKKRTTQTAKPVHDPSTEES
jgi:hypothetical protein